MSFIAEADAHYAHEKGRDNRQSAWILSDRDCWYPNPFYTGPAVRHPEDDAYDENDCGPYRTTICGQPERVSTEARVCTCGGDIGKPACAFCLQRSAA